MTPRPQLLVTLALPVLLLAAACGDGDSDALSSSSTTPSTATSTSTSPAASPSSTGQTKAAYIAASEAICKTANETIAAIPEPNDDASVRASLLATITTASAATDQLATLAAAQPGQRHPQRLLINPLKAQVAGLKDYQAKLPATINSEDDLPPVPAVTPTADLAGIQAYGFDQCATAAES